MTQAGPVVCDGLRKCLCGCGLCVAVVTCPRRGECRLLFRKGPRLPMEKDGTGPAPLHVVHRARISPKPVLNWGPHEAIGLRAAAGGNHG